MYLILDTETNGKIKDFGANPLTSPNAFPRITQIAWYVLDKDFNDGGAYEYLIKPNGWEIPKEKFFIDNEMSTERCLENGIELRLALRSLIVDMEICEYIICHNIAFDAPILMAEMARLNLKANKKLKRICTMKSSIAYCSLPRNKYPTLKELHIKLFGYESEDTAHDALGDVMTTARCFVELVKLGIICL